MMNHIDLMGRLVRDPELRRTQNGIPVCSFSIACERDYKSQDGEKQTDFIDIVAWRHTAEFVSKYLTKGRMASINGRLQLRDWVDKEGRKRRSAEILANNVYFADSRPRDTGTGPVAATPAYGRPQAALVGSYTGSGSELPF